MDTELLKMCRRRLERLARGRGKQIELLIDEVDPKTGEEARVWIYRNFYDPEDAQFLLETCQEQLPWTQHTHRMGTEARLTSLLGEPGVTHLYSGSRRETEPWSQGREDRGDSEGEDVEVAPAAQEIRELAELINEVFGCELNACLANRYRGKTDYISYHGDTEIRAPDNFVFALSLGQSRPFYFKRMRETESGPAKEVLKTEIHSGDLMLMEGATQKLFHHSVPKRTGKNIDWGERISLTYRELGN